MFRRGKTMGDHLAGAIVIEAALNGARSRVEHPGVPCTPEEVATDAIACASAGASVVHIHARTESDDWQSHLDWYRETHLRIRDQAPDLLISITSLRPESVAASNILNLVEALTAERSIAPDAISVNLGHIVNWLPSDNPESGRETVHFPNSYRDIASLLAVCAEGSVQPELGLMDLGFLNNAVTLEADNHLPNRPWFLIELDSVYGSGNQLAPSVAANLELFVSVLEQLFPGAPWCAHGAELPGYVVLSQAIDLGGHVRVGIEDAVLLPGSDQPASNAEQVTWAVQQAARTGRRPTTATEAREIIGISH